MDEFGAPDRPPAAPGWYPDPGGSSSHRYWDGRRWTEALSAAIPRSEPHADRDDARTFALAAHLSALALLAGLPLAGPLVIYLVKKDDPFVRRHAAEALNFNLSLLLYGAIASAAFVLVWVAVDLRLLAAIALLAVLWLVCTCIAATKAGEGEAYRYPLTIRFVR